MVDWQITATTIVCEAVAEEVTLLVHGDWTVKCTGFAKYDGNRRANLELVKHSLEIKRGLGCKGLDCPYIAEYKQKLMAKEESGAKSK